ncbi:MAG: GNAT family N-acetyltransferase [Peptococcaceae bacterium]
MTPTFRTAIREDVPLIYQMICDLALYENLLNEVVCDEATLEDWLFERHRAEVIFAMVEDKEVGFALFFHNFSTFLGRSGLYLEDLYVMPDYRHQGIGTAMFKELARIALARECGRMEWWCLDWNQASINFYKGLGAEAMEDWTVYRLSGDTLHRLAE